MRASLTARADAVSTEDSHDGASPGAVADAGGNGPSRPGTRDTASPGDGSDVAAVPERRCLWCEGELAPLQLRYCSKLCRQTAWRSRQLAVAEDLGDTPKRLCYGDPPFVGLSRRYYRDEPTFGGEVDHAALIARLATFDGWALSCSAKSLRALLPLCPPEARVAPWVKPNGVPGVNRGASNAWEAVIYVQARRRRPGFRDWLCAKPARGGGTLMGRKPLAFCAFLFRLLGASPVDELEDLFPGSGVIGRSWSQFRALGSRVASSTSTTAGVA